MDCYPLTQSQRLIYDMEKFAGGSIANICGSMLFSEKVDIKRIERALNEIYRINDALRIQIKESSGTVQQYVSDYEYIIPEIKRFTSKNELHSFGDFVAKKPIDINGKLCRFYIISLPEQTGIIVKLHHLIGDAWTLSLLGTQLNSMLQGNTPEAYSFIEHIKNEVKYIESKRYKRDRDFFETQFKKCDETTFLSEKQAENFNSKRSTFSLSSEQTDMLRAYTKRNGVSIFQLVLTAISVYFNRIKMNSEQFYIGTAVLNRAGIFEHNTAGMFINTVPMLINIKNELSFSNNLQAVSETAFSVLRHEKYNYGALLTYLREQYHFAEKLYDIIFSYQNAAVTGKSESTWYPCGMQTESLQIHAEDRDNTGILQLHYDYLTDKFTSSEIEAMHFHICNLLFDAINDDSKKPYELSMLSAEEKQNIQFDFNDTDADYPKDKCVHELFEEQAAKTPDTAAVIASDKIITYKELNEEANRIAHSLIEKGVGVGDIVAIILPRNSHLISAVFGVLKSGAAYLPIDPANPQDRIEYILSDSGTKFCINTNNISELIDNKNSYNPEIAVSNQQICYCIYTSGSTGLPKGTLLTHKNAVNYISRNDKNVFHKIIDDNSKSIVSITTIGFDIFVTESLLPLSNGLTVVLADENQARIQSELNDLLTEHHADIIQTTPTKIKSLISDISKIDYLKKLKTIILGGEALDPSLVKQLQLLSTARIYNIYGPTETTVWATSASAEKDKEITIGKPLANTQIYIADKYMQIVPVGVTGELCIAGNCVGAGYLNRPELTAERFIDNPFGKGRLYKTGDLAYWREDGNIVYVGRNDFQVKIRGLRIELGEIENAVSSVDGISQSVVIVRKNDEGRQLICAFYTGNDIEPKEIRAHIGKSLPKYMLPHIFTHLDEMPLTPSGKLDRKALPNINLENIPTDTDYSAPATEEEKLLCRIMAQTLDIKQVGITDDFFNLGGDSLKAIEFISSCESEGFHIDLQTVFEHPTPAEMLKSIEIKTKSILKYNDSDFKNFHKLISVNNQENIYKVNHIPVGNLLLAGATGYLGAHILDEFLKHDAGTAYCIVRGKSLEDSERRLNDLLQFYFGDTYINNDRIVVLCGDLTEEGFALSESDYADLISNVDTVVNSAASVKHYGSYDFFRKTNVKSVENIIDFCKKADAKLIHISTTSVAGNDFDSEISFADTPEEIIFTERDLYIGQPLDNVYVRSKFEAECAVLAAMKNGLEANIMRMGNLTNRRSDGKFQRNYESNAFLKHIKAIIELGYIPSDMLELKTELTPIDEAANAVMTITRHFRTDLNVFHIENTNMIKLKDLCRFINILGFDLKSISEKQFIHFLNEAENNPETKYIFETFINEIGKDGRLHYESSIKIGTDFTNQHLQALGFKWKETDLEYIKNYFNYFDSIGFIKKPD